MAIGRKAGKRKITNSNVKQKQPPKVAKPIEDDEDITSESDAEMGENTTYDALETAQYR